MTVGGATTEYCKGHLRDNLSQFGVKCNVEDRTEEMAILSLQGPKRLERFKIIYLGNCFKKVQFILIFCRSRQAIKK